MSEQALAIRESHNIEVSARTPDEMKESNQKLIQWCDSKIRELRTDHIELDAAYKSALKKKWKHSVLQRHAEIAKKRIIFYGKLRTALKGGYYIVPNFPVTVFAMRTERNKPLRLASTVRQNYPPSMLKEQQTSSLPAGAGSYVSPKPNVTVENFGEVSIKDGSKTIEWGSWAEKWNPVEFPICMSKLEIMEATNRAMEIKLFDDFGVLSNASIHRRGCGDPIIVGRIRDPRSTTWNQRYVSFIIAWHLDTRTL